MRAARRIAGALALAVLACGRAEAQAPADTAGAALTIHLMTMGPGADVWERFGHNAIWVHDAGQGTDLVYNYGMFSFRQENFLLRFIQGRMRYWMAPDDLDHALEVYRWRRRWVRAQELALAPAQKVALRDFLAWNAREENRYYRYDYYRDNCSTRVRDALDQVLGGALRRATQGRPAGDGITYRFHTRRLTTNDPLLYTGLELGLGPLVDRPLDRWDEMFLPDKVAEAMRGLTVAGPDGAPRPLVAAERTLFESDVFQVDQRPPRWIPAYLGGGVVLGLLLAWLGARAPASGGARRGFIALGGLWCLTAGAAGATLAGLWAFTDHAVAYGNLNLLQASPLALGLLAVLTPLALGGARAARTGRALALAMLALSALGLLLLPFTAQVNGELVALAVPVNAGLWLGVRRAAR